MIRIKNFQFFNIKSWLKTLFFFLIFGALIGIPPIFELENQIEADLTEKTVIVPEKSLEENLITLQNNTLIPLSSTTVPESDTGQRIKVIVTAYSSSTWETDETPFITAAGTWVREGIIANNLLPFGTKIKLPEIYGDKIFVVEDRMSWKKGYYHIDIWFPSYWEALNFGAKRTYLEIIEEG
ncbi:3D domain-containing protein [Patescibacteria group bacterium]